MASHPSETLTFLYTDIEGSTRLWQQHPAAMPRVIARHDDLLREIAAAHGGSVFRTMGDAVCAAFRTAADALQAALDGQRGLWREPWEDGIVLRVRMAIHSGAAELRDSDYTGHTLNRVARLLAAGHGGQILISDIARGLLLDDLAPDVMLSDLGEHRLKDLDRPEHIFQVQADGLPHDFPPPRTVDAASTNLPTQATSFVGREAEVEAVTAMLRDPAIRLLTLLGPGGTGKTRLALCVGAEVLDEHRDGVFFVPLASIQDPQLIGPVVASALGVRESEDMSVEERLARYLRDKDMLMILDNFEQILAAAPLISRLLGGAPNLKVLVTSRSVLHLAAEHGYPVPPLSVPDLAYLPDSESITQYDAVALFVQRARAVKPDFTVTNANAPAVAEICYRLDGLPLAVELAAARTRLFPPEALLKRLATSLTVLTGGSRDLPARQQTLRATIDWSYSLLSSDQQSLFSRLAVFSGGWSLEAAEEVCNLEGDLDVLNALAALVEQSLVQQGGKDEPRFTMLETIREYASGLLHASADADVLHSRHAAWCARLLQSAPDLFTELASIGRISPFFFQEQDNLRAALHWNLARQDWVQYTTLLRRLCVFWYVQGQWTEALSWTEGILPTVPLDRTQERAFVVFGAGYFISRLGQYEVATRRLEEAVSILRELGRKRELSTSLFMLGELTAQRGEGRAARSILEEALTVSRQMENQRNVPLALIFLGVLSREEGDHPGARAHMEEALTLARRSGNKVGAAGALNGLADLARLEGDYDHAESLYQQSARLAQETGVLFTRAGIVHNLAYIAHHRGNDVRARRGFVEAIDLFRDLGDPRGIAECVAGIAVLDAHSDPVLSTHLLAAAFHVAESMGTRLSSSNQAEYEGALAAIRAQLDESSFQAARQEGRSMSLEEAVARAIERDSNYPTAPS
jgi:predicted ATPase/class 3 adenylate cyclase